MSLNGSASLSRPSVAGGDSHQGLSDHTPAAVATTQGGACLHYPESATEPQLRELDKHGCSHYRRRCSIICPTCNEQFDCRHCHNESKNTDKDSRTRHELPRFDVKLVVCSLCHTKQEVKQQCQKCGVFMGNYFCPKCKLFDDSTGKRHWHCEKCGLCRVGGKENFFHCDRCGCCYSIKLESNHNCVENSMHHNCPVCFEYMFDSIRDITVLNCGHTMHLECMRQMQSHGQYACPICSRSVMDMSTLWAALDVEVRNTPMPEEYRNRRVWIFCNDCGNTCQVLFHVVGQKCNRCGSYNTRPTGQPTHEPANVGNVVR